ncbi:MAG TPA: metal ABC transporter permease [Polyangiaceae bacterium]|nr:metal ABC transporter permease [Polyangiaceae bacterium]
MNDEFDAILAAPSASTTRAPAPPSSAESTVEAPVTHAQIAVESPRFSEFVENWALYRDPILCAVLAGAGLSALGLFVVLRRAVFVTATLTQAAGLGVALAFFVEIHYGLAVPPVLGALISSVLFTALAGARPAKRLSRETAIGFTFVAASALAVLVGDCITQEAHDIAAILFGTAVLVRPLDLTLVAVTTALSLGALFWLARALTFTGFDPEGAKIQGLPVRALEFAFWSLFAIEVSVATRALGSLPVFAFSVVPAAAGLVLANQLRAAMALSIVFGMLAAAAGYLFAFVFSLPVGASQAAVAALFLLLARAFSRLRTS